MLGLPIIIKNDRLHKIIDERKPQGRFVSYQDTLWVAVDNRTGDAWTEDFNTLHEALEWLK